MQVMQSKCTQKRERVKQSKCIQLYNLENKAEYKKEIKVKTNGPYLFTQYCNLSKY